MILPILTYSSTASLHFTATQLKQLESLEARASMIIQDQSLPKIVNLIRKQACVVVKKILENECCSNLEGYFELIDHSIKTRNNGFLLRIPKTRLEFGKKAFKFEGANLFNSLPLKIRKENDARKFKNYVKKYFNV
jgi:hypothetical protein